MAIYRFVVSFSSLDPRSSIYTSDARALGFDILRIKCMDLYFIEGQLSEEDCRQLAFRLLSDPVTQSYEWSELDLSKVADPLDDDITGSDKLWKGSPEITIDVVLRSGVTDPVSDEIVRSAHELGFAGVNRASSGLRFLIDGSGFACVERLATAILVNNTIQRWAIGEIQPSFPEEAEAVNLVETIQIRYASDEELLLLSKDRRAALDLVEMKCIQNYFISIKRDPTDVEFEMIAQTWSEHCVHKTFKANIQIFEDEYNFNKNAGSVIEDKILPVYSGAIDSLIKTYLKAATEKINAPWVISAFVDNAGIIEFDDKFDVSIKVETHNHPSAIEPFGGANTGLGGVIRDVIGVSAKPIAATDVLCFGMQETPAEKVQQGVLHPRRIKSGVIAGIQDYGNKIGIPTVNGAILYDESFTANPLVFCGCVGLAPRGRHIKSPRPGDRIVILGGRTGRDGLRGATFSSMTMDAQTGKVSGASVQIGDPITEKGLIDVIVRARDARLYTDITDCGAGGLSSAVGEMTSSLGGVVNLDSVRLKYSGLLPWEIWLSEAQERMVVSIAPENMLALEELCSTFDTEYTDIGFFTDTGCIQVFYADQCVLDLKNSFLHDGIPQRQLTAIINHQRIDDEAATCQQIPPSDYLPILLKLLAHPNIATKADTVRLYDHEIQGGTVVKPLTGAMDDGPSDAAVIKPAGTAGLRGIVLANGINPEYGKRDAYKMAWAVLDEAIRNSVAVGADPKKIAILDNFCWGDPLNPKTLGTLVEAVRGCHDAALHYRSPFISGKDSLNNEYMGVDGLRHSIPPTLLISALGIIDDVTKSITMDLKGPGGVVYLVGDFVPSFGGSHYCLISEISGTILNESVPTVSSVTPKVYFALHEAIERGLISSAHDISEGGLLVCAAEMCIGGRLGLDVRIESTDFVRSLFAETTGCFLVEIKPEFANEFTAVFANLPVCEVAKVTATQEMRVTANQKILFKVHIDRLVSAWGANL